MAPVTPTGVPAQIVAGDTLLFDVSFGDFPASESWTLAFEFAGAGRLTTTAGEVVNDGAKYTVTVPATRTIELDSKPGVYRCFATLTGTGSYAGRKYTLEQRTVEVISDPSNAAAGDFQAQCEKDLAVVEAAYSGQLADGMKSYTIRGRQVVLFDRAELAAERSRLKREVWKLKNKGSGIPVLRRYYHGPGSGYGAY
jgi:hypothetical protein